MSEASKTSIFNAISDRKTLALAEIIAANLTAAPLRVLVVGCGSGAEAGFLARHFGAETTGIDLGGEFEFDHLGAAPAALRIMNAESLEFPDNHFDVCYSFHALEHITHPLLALEEMSRVLKPGGTFVIGTPNQSRLIGYVGSAEPFLHKVKWNLADLRMRLMGRWSNEAGAHAGFREHDLMAMCRSTFGDAKNISHAYYEKLYGGSVVGFLKLFELYRVIYPCVYVLGVR